MRIHTALSMCLFLVIVVAMPRAVAAQAQAGKASLSVCNKGTVTVEVVAASLTSDLLARHWEVEGTSIAPGACESTYEGSGLRQRVFLGFGFKNSRGQFVAGRVPTIPDFGKTSYRDMVTAAMEGATERATLQPLSGRTVCVHADRTLWGSKDETFPAAGNCAEFQLGGGAKSVGTGGFYALPLVLDFRPGASWCWDSPPGPIYQGGCAGGEHYMNVVANPATGAVAVTPSTREGSDAPPVRSDIGKMQDKLQQQFGDALLKSYGENEKRKAAAAAAEDPMAKAEAARKAFEDRQSRIDYKSEHERNLSRVRELAEFSPVWLASTAPLYVRGTVSRVEPSPDGRKPARVYFKESPDGAFVACLSPDWFGLGDLNHFVGERLEVRGRVTQSHCGGRVADIQVTVPVMIYELNKGTPPDEAILPGMKAPGPGITPSAVAAIPIATRLRVSLRSNVDLLHAKAGETFQGVLAAPVRLPDGAIPQGAAVVLVCMPSTSRQAASAISFEVSSVAADGKIWRVSTESGTPVAGTSNPNVLSAGTTLVFAVNGTDRAVAGGR